MEKIILNKINTGKKIVKGARFELARSTDQQIPLVKKDLNLHLKSVTLDQLGQPSNVTQISPLNIYILINIFAELENKSTFLEFKEVK